MTEFGTRRVVVGYDGTDAARKAVDWAADEAERRHLALDVVHVVQQGDLAATPATVSPWEPSPLVQAAQAVTNVGVDRARQRQPRLAVRGRTVVGSPREELPIVARDAELLVVGSRGRADRLAGVLGSVAAAVAVHAPCPVVVVRGDRVLAPGPHHPVVVGDDGSEAATRALRHAADLAAAAQAPLTVVCARRPLSADGWARAYWQAVDPVNDPDAVSDEAARVVAGRARDLVRARHPGLVTRSLVAEGPAAGVILAHARDAALVVVGSRGRGGVASLLLGSVSHSVVHGATCPVLVVPAGADLPAATG
jgi:nucleotide-binding universal stress UspA family protein